jgi:cephalosporin hydroxylase
MYTKDEYENILEIERKKMFEDAPLKEAAREVIFTADKYSWIQQSKFMGETCLQLPHDLFAIQEIIYKIQPDYILELGVAWGGSILFYASILEALGHGKVIGIDKYIPEDLKNRISSKGSISKRISLQEMDSSSATTLEQIKRTIHPPAKVILILDSCHSQDHVLKELEMYSPFVNTGSYIICCSTIIEHKEPHHVYRDRPWGKGNNPRTAMSAFLSQNTRFEIDRYFEEKLLLSCNPDGYLKCVKNYEEVI